MARSRRKPPPLPERKGGISQKLIATLIGSALLLYIVVEKIARRAARETFGAAFSGSTF